MTNPRLPPPSGSNMIFEVIGYLLVVVESGLSGLILANYWRAWKVIPDAARLLPVHALLIILGTLLLSWVSIARLVEFPRPIWGVITFVPIIMICAALVLVLRWQTLNKRK